MANGKRVFVSDFIVDVLDIEREILNDVAEVVSLDAANQQELIGRIEHADAIMLYHTISIGKETIDRLKQCKLIVRCGVGFDNVDIEACRTREIPVANVPDYGTEEVADSAIGLTLSLARGINFLNSRLRARIEPWSYMQVAPVRRLRDRVFGIIGLGRIGTAAAIRAKSLGMKVIFFDPYKADGYDKALGIQRAASLNELLEQSHIVSIHCVLSDETRHMINETTIAKMPQGSFLINTARGGIVDAQSVAAAIESGHLAGAGIDVLEYEPADDHNPLVAAWRDPLHPAYHRVIINPHSAFYSEEGLQDMRVSGAKACRAALLGEQIRNVVN